MDNLKPLYIFDLDGTLANNDHRKYILDSDKPNWDLYNFECTKDVPIKPMIDLLNSLILSGAEIIFFTARKDICRYQTEDWIYCHTRFAEAFTNDNLKMRGRKKYYGDSASAKKQMYEDLTADQKQRLVCVFEDRQMVVDLWRSIGVQCLQVQPGDF